MLIDSYRLTKTRLNSVTARSLRKVLRQHGCVEVRQAGSHLTVRCGECVTTIAVHSGDIPAGTLAKIGRDLERCLGKGWLHP